METPILLDFNNRVATVVINREARRNSLDHHAMRALSDAFDRIAESDATVTIISGTGTLAFCAGDDIKAYRERSAEESVAHYELGLRTFDAIERHPTLVIAAIEGYCMGGGLELALCADYRIASREANFALPEVLKLKAYPSWGGLTRLPRLVGRQLSRRIALLGETFEGDNALAAGLADRLVVPGEALAASQSFAAEIAGDIERSIFSTAKRLLLQAEESSSASLQLMNQLSEASQRFSGDT